MNGGVLAPRPAPPGGGPLGMAPGAGNIPVLVGATLGVPLATLMLPGYGGGMPGGGPICNISSDAVSREYLGGGGPLPVVG